MRTTIPALLLLVAPLTACASLKDSVVTPGALHMSATEPATSVVVAEPVVQQSHRSDSDTNPSELAIWNDPAFQKRLIESYVAQTEVEPRLTADETEVMQEVLAFLSADQRDEAEALLARNRGATASAVIDYTLGTIYLQDDRFEEAAAAFEIAAEKHAKFLRAWQNMGVAYVRLGQYAQAIPAHTRVIELGAGDAVTYGLLGYSHLSVGNYVSAESAYRMAVLLDANTLDWQMGLARAFFKQERFAEAASLFGALIDEYPENTDLWLFQANAFIGLDDPLAAAENYELVDRLGGSTCESLVNLGDIYVNEQLFDLGVDSYIRALEMDPEAELDRPLRAARVLTAQGALDETERLVKRIETLRGARLETDFRKQLLKLRARIAVARGAGDDEARVLEEIVALDPLDGEALILLGQHAQRGGDLEQAAFYYERAAAIEAFEADAKVRHAQLLIGEGRYKESLPLLRRAQQLKYRENIQDFMEQVERIAQARPSS